MPKNKSFELFTEFTEIKREFTETNKNWRGDSGYFGERFLVFQLLCVVDKNTKFNLSAYLSYSQRNEAELIITVPAVYLIPNTVGNQSRLDIIEEKLGIEIDSLWFELPQTKNYSNDCGCGDEHNCPYWIDSEYIEWYGVEVECDEVYFDKTRDTTEAINYIEGILAGLKLNILFPNISNRLLNVLKANKIYNLNSLAAISKPSFRKLKFAGIGSLAEAEQLLTSKGLEFKPE